MVLSDFLSVLRYPSLTWMWDCQQSTGVFRLNRKCRLFRTVQRKVFKRQNFFCLLMIYSTVAETLPLLRWSDDLRCELLSTVVVFVDTENRFTNSGIHLSCWIWLSFWLLVTVVSLCFCRFWCVQYWRAPESNQPKWDNYHHWSYSPCPGTAIKSRCFFWWRLHVSSGATSPTVYGAGGPPGGAAGSPGQKRSVSVTGNTLKVITGRAITDFW